MHERHGPRARDVGGSAKARGARRARGERGEEREAERGDDAEHRRDDDAVSIESARETIDDFFLFAFVQRRTVGEMTVDDIQRRERARGGGASARMNRHRVRSSARSKDVDETR